MARDFFINGESLVMVKGGMHTSTFQSGNISTSTQLGLTSDAIRVTPIFYHKEINTDDFGPDVPVSLMTHLAEVRLQIPLIHFDYIILDTCMAESTGWSTGTWAGTLPPMGTMMDGGASPIFSSGNHFLSINILSPVGIPVVDPLRPQPSQQQPGSSGLPWRFLAGYMTGPPVEIPLGTEKTIAYTNWRFIPYPMSGQVQQLITKPTPIVSPGGGNQGVGNLLAGIAHEFISSGVVLWDHLVNN